MWEHISKSLMTAAEQVLGHTLRKNADWFDENIDYIHQLLESKYRAHAAYKNNPSSPRLSAKWKEARPTCQRELRELEHRWWIKKSEEIIWSQRLMRSGILQVYKTSPLLSTTRITS